MIGLVGAHRTGKTSLAKAFAAKNKYKFLETSVGSIFAELGYDPAAVYDFSTRLTIQEEILRRLNLLYAEYSTEENVIADRTPIDILCYTVAEAIGDRVLPKDQARMQRFTEACFKATNMRFAKLVLVQPAIPIVAAPGKAAANKAYIEHLNSLCLGLLTDEALLTHCSFIPRDVISMNDRVSAVEGAVQRARERAISLRKTMEVCQLQ